MREELIDFPCSPSWTEYYYERGLTSRRAVAPRHESVSARRRAILHDAGEGPLMEAALRTIRAQEAALAALRLRLTLAERALADRTPARTHVIEEDAEPRP